MNKKSQEHGLVSRRKALAFLGSASMFGLTGIDLVASKNVSLTNQTSKKMKETVFEGTKMKSIGIIGGLGPQATMDLEMRIHKVAQKMIPPMENSSYPPMVVQYYRHPPIVLTKDHRPVVPWTVDPRLLEVARNLGGTSDFLIIASNGIHHFQKEIERASGKTVVSMIDATLEEVKRRNWRRVGVLGFMNPGIYTVRLKEMGIMFETVDYVLQQKLNSAIFRVMEGTESAIDNDVIMEAIAFLRSKKVDGIIPGCTELPLLLGTSMNAGDLLNPAQLLAEAAVKYSLLN